MPSQKEELVQRIKAKKKEIEAEIYRLKADAQGVVNEKQEKLEAKAKELTAVLQEATNDFSEKIAKKMNEWLK